MEQPKQQKQAKDPQKEIEIALAELEERVDRLRTLYEQYFLGFEKIEPSVARKEVDRRFAMLRKAPFRNTALRFRFNVVTQKFNTYAMYWTRICRQIEEGTYKRHVVRAARRFGATPDRRAAQDDTVDVELDLEVELGDFEEEDLDAILAEADASAAAYGRGAADTVPPGAAPSAPPAPEASWDSGASAARGAGLRPGLDPSPASVDGPPSLPETRVPTPTAFEVDGGRAPASEERPAAHRVVRPAALPPGSKGRVLLRKTNPNGDRTGLDIPPSSKQGGPISTSSIRPSPVSAGVDSQRSPAAAPSSQRALPTTGPHPILGPASQRAPSATGQRPLPSLEAPATPTAAFQPRPLPNSERRLPLPPPQRAGAIPTPPSPISPRTPPAIRPAVRGPGGLPAPKTPAVPMRPVPASQPRLPTGVEAEPGHAGTQPRTPVAAPGSLPKTPVARPADARPKAPPPLPSQIKKP